LLGSCFIALLSGARGSCEIDGTHESSVGTSGTMAW
jgi:hypothetical protein